MIQKTAKIIIHDLVVNACHGVNEEEKTQKQPFSISVEIVTDIGEAVKNDDITRTVSYSEVCKQIKTVVESTTYNLIETLANKLACSIACKYYNITSVKVLLKKLEPPMKVKPNDVAVEVVREYKRCYLSLGSSVGDRNGYLDFALEKLINDIHIRNVRESGRIETEPYGGVAKNKFINSAVELETIYSPQELLKIINNIEEEAGRVRNKKWEDRVLDIDIVLFGNEIINDENLTVPHKEMHKREFVLRPLLLLNDALYHPLLGKYLKDILEEIN